MKSRQILVTTALPYANGALHLGHIFEGLYADFWVRYQKMQGHDVAFICADDTHGTPIMVEARKRKITPEQLIQEAWQKHTQDFKDFSIEHSLYSSTHSDANRELCEYFYKKMQDGGYLGKKNLEQLYCEHDKMFLPDRFVKGTCPKCGALDQYGDSCDICSATYSPSDLKSPGCSICGNKPVMKSSEQILFKLENLRDFLKSWLPDHLAKESANKMLEWFNEPLRDWDISRNAPYFGFQIPGHPDKYFYVWVDAPMGYVSTTKEYFKSNPQKFSDFWSEGSESKTEVYHLIGKDIVYFHTLFWPALLNAAGFRTPTSVWVHGHIMVNGEKMSKSKGTFLSARVYLEHLDPMYLRYYFASKISNGVDDMDFNLEDFAQRTNSDLIGKITNLASRGAQMLSNKLDGVLDEPDTEGAAILKLALDKSKEISEHYENREFVKAINEIRSLADVCNRYFDDKAPWKTLETNPQDTKKVLTTTLLLFRSLAIFLKPILPNYSDNVATLFSENSYQWSDLNKSVGKLKLKPYTHLATRIDPLKIKAMMESNKKELAERAALDKAAKTDSQNANSNSVEKNKTNTTNRGTGISTEIEIDTFSQVDLRVAEIVSAEAIPEADKLLRLKVSLGPYGEKQIIAGIRSAYNADTLVGRKVVIVANLKPRKMKFGLSEGMALAAGSGGKDLFLLSPDSGAKPGDPVK